MTDTIKLQLTKASWINLRFTFQNTPEEMQHIEPVHEAKLNIAPKIVDLLKRTCHKSPKKDRHGNPSKRPARRLWLAAPAMAGKGKP